MGATRDGDPRPGIAVAFFRNLNQGQRGSPSRLELTNAMTRGGASDVATFQVNGTVIFTAIEPEVCTRRAVEILGAESVWNDIAFARSADWLIGLVRDIRVPPDQDPRALELSVFSESVAFTTSLPITGRRCAVISAGAGWAVTINESPIESNATPTIERSIGQPVTSRGLPTLIRLITRVAR